MKYFLIFTLFLASLFGQMSIEQTHVTQLKGKLYETSTQKPITGTILSHFEDGTLKETLSVLDGVPNGISKVYYPSGKLHYEFSYKDGKYDGLYQNYYENGNLHYKMTFKDDLLEGLIEAYNEDGTFSKKMSYEEFMAR